MQSQDLMSILTHPGWDNDGEVAPPAVYFALVHGWEKEDAHTDTFNYCTLFNIDYKNVHRL